MSPRKCIVCLKAEMNDSDQENLSSQIFLDFGDALAANSKLINFDADILTLCSRCQQFLIRLAKLNANLKTLVSKVQQSCDARASKIQAVHSAGQSSFETYDNPQDSQWQENHCDQQSVKASSVTCDPRLLEFNEFHNESGTDVGSYDNVTENLDQNHEVDGLPVERTIQHEAEDPGTCQLTSQVDARASPSVNVYEDHWLPKSLTLPKSSEFVKRISEREFVYLDNYPFQGTETGFKCGLCPTIPMFSTYKNLPLWQNLFKHMRRYHMGDPKVRTSEHIRRCVEVIPNRFEYGKFSFEDVGGRFKCGECGILTLKAKPYKNRTRLIRRHIFDQHENSSKTYACKDCGKVLNNRKSLRAHKITKHKNPSGQFPCSDCGAIFGSSVAAIAHRRTVHRKLNRKKFFCEICGKVFNQKAFLEDHVAFVHNGPKMNECKVCGKMFSSRSGLNIHENSHTEQSTYKCETCGRTFNKNYLFTRHKKLLCTAQYEDENEAGAIANVYDNSWLPKTLTLPKFSQLVKRKSERDFIYLGKYPFQGTESGFKCGFCCTISMFCSYKKSLPWQNLIKHMRMHHMGDPKVQTSRQQRCVEVTPNHFQYGKYSIEKVDEMYKCGECGVLKKRAKAHKMEFILKHINNQHENSSMTYICEFCGVIYKKKMSLTRHKITKHGDPNSRFPCSECGKVFRNRVAAMGHRRAVHRKNPQNNFICKTCGKKFGRKDLLEDHVASVHKGLKLHECEECGKKFSSKTGLKNHQNTHRGNSKYIYNIPETQSVGENCPDAIANIEEDSEVDSFDKVLQTSEDVEQSHGDGQPTSKVHAGASINAYENYWLPKSLTIKSSPHVKRLSERDFIYKDEYPFHGTEFGFKCGLCPVVSLFCTYKTSGPWANLTRHIKGHHMGDPGVQTTRTVLQRCIEVAPNRFQYGKYSFERVHGMFKCGECGLLRKPVKPFAESHRSMLKHILDRHEKPWRTFACNYCGVVYNNRNSLRNHKITKHESPNGQVPCRDCGKVFANRIAANGHRHYVHRHRKKFMCEMCGKDFRQKDAMEDHVAFVHNGQSMHECEECGKKFASKKVLNTHKNNHTGRKKYVCDICGMDFTQQQSIKRHKKTAHGVDK